MKKAILAFIISVIIFTASVNCYGTGDITLFSDAKKQSYLDSSLCLDNGERFNAVEQDGIMYVSDKEESFSAVISCDKLDEVASKLIRDYYNDSSSTEEELFLKFIDYKKSYFDALKNYYRRAFLYGGDKSSAESNMKIFGEYKEKIYGQESDAILYNTLDADVPDYREEIHISLFIPVHSAMSVYSINFTVKKGFLDETSLQHMSELVKAINIPGLPAQSEQLKVFEDKNALDSANSGIYPELGKGGINYTELVNKISGYKLSYPSTFIPYRQNSIVDSFDYKSFKIDHRSFFSITAEDLHDTARAIENKVGLIKDSYNKSISVVEEGEAVINAKAFRYIRYEIPDSSGTVYLQDYFIINDGRLYTIRLNSRLTKPDRELQDEFERIVSSLEFISVSQPESGEEQHFTKYINRVQGYTFSYPEGWQMVESTQDDTFRVFTVKNPDLSGPLDIVIAEGELYSEISPAEALAYVTGEDTAGLQKYFKRYSAPYLGRIRNLLESSYQVKDGAVYLSKLVNYVDVSDRSKLCYSVDVIRGKKTYSLFISVSDYMTKDGEIENRDIASAVNSIARSFKVEKPIDIMSLIKNWIISLNWERLK